LRQSCTRRACAGVSRAGTAAAQSSGSTLSAWRVTLNFLATIGVCSFFFQRIQGQDGFNYAIPLYTSIFLVALGADYTIFLMSRVREEAQRRGLADYVPFAVSRTGGVITSAGLILAGTFLVLTTLPLTILYQLGICVAVGILLDAFVVRGLLVPGLVLLLGKGNWWPGQLVSVNAVGEEKSLSSDASSTVTTGQKP
jgi:putative drug exporter of the RND superfamily